MNVLAIDPGLRHIGWALYVDGSLEAAGLSTGVLDTQERGPGAWLAAVADIQIPDIRVDVLVSEYPQVYSVRNVNPDDLLMLASVVGAVCARWSKAEHVLYRPREWKGQRSKEATLHHAHRVLRIDEANRLGRFLAPIPENLRHNVHDAVGIGLHHLRRMR